MITTFNPIFPDFNESWCTCDFQLFGRRVKIVSLTLLFAVSSDISFSCCNIIESGFYGRADVPSYDGILRTFSIFVTFFQHFVSAILFGETA
jgi:hypothetical protein